MARHHPLGDIDILRSTLLKSYKVGFPILKELVQNAEDAQSTCLDYGWIEGIPNAEHPLLRSPALFMLDNGNFTEENAKSIRYILGGTSKSNQQDSIGKFGLGLKSVFHLCEAFFYIAPDKENSKYPRWDIFNPWADAFDTDEYHQDWNAFSRKDRDYIIKNTLAPILQKSEYQNKWFLIWMPLRQEEHCANNSKVRYIKDDEFFPEIPNFLKNTDIQKQLSLLPSLLSNLNQIRYWEKNFRQPKFNIIVDEKSERRSALSQLEHNPEKPLKGKVSDGQVKQVEFAGYEIVPSSEIFPESEIKKRPGFPEEFINIKPHSAVVFSRLHSNVDTPHSLTLRTAVFLPIGEEESIDLKSSSKHSYYLTLHGYFFVDSGRTGILGWDKNNFRIDNTHKEGDDNRTLREKEWNFHLYEILMTQILDTFDKFVSKYSLSESEVSAICKALGESKFFQEQMNRDKICQEKQWIFRILSITPQNNKWELLDNTYRVLPLAKIPQENLFSSLPKKTGLSQCILTLSDAPNLRNDGKISAQWIDEEIISIINNLSQKNIFKEHSTIEDLVDFLSFIKTSKKTISDPVQNYIVQFLKSGLLQLSLSEINSEIKEAWQSLINLVDDSKIIYIDVLEYTFKHLIKIELNILLLSKPFFSTPGNAKEKQLSYKDAKAILSKINEWINQLYEQGRNVNALELTLKQFLKLSKNELIKILSENENWKCLIGSQYKATAASFYSYKDFKNEKILFRRSKNDLLDSLEKAVQYFQPIVVDEEIAELISNAPSISPVICDQNVCRSILNKTPLLNDKPERIKLLDQLLSCLNMSPQIRYLLHGQAAQYNNLTTLLYIISESDALWIEVTKQVLETKKESWRLIEPVLAERILRAKYGGLKIESLTPDAVIDLLKEPGVDAKCINPQELTAQQCEILLIETGKNTGNKDLWKSLHIHLTVNDKFVSIEENTYLENPDFSLEESLKEKVILIKRNPQLTQTWIPEWNASSAIEFLLSQPDPHTYREMILRIWHSFDDNQKFKYKERLKDAAWLTVKVGEEINPIAPKYILKCPNYLKNYEQTLVGLKPGYYLPFDLETSEEQYNDIEVLFYQFNQLDILQEILTIYDS
ncbi:MAG: hypothetical protein WBB28_21775 [Crinalium sp.]